MNGAARMAMLPNRFISIDNPAAKIAGKQPTIKQITSSSVYATAGGNPPYRIIEYVSHQHVPTKKQVPKSQPVANERIKEPLSRSTAKRSGMNAIQAKNQYSKSGNANVSNIEEIIANPRLCQEGKNLETRAKIMTLSLTEKLNRLARTRRVWQMPFYVTADPFLQEAVNLIRPVGQYESK